MKDLQKWAVKSGVQIKNSKPNAFKAETPETLTSALRSFFGSTWTQTKISAHSHDPSQGFRGSDPTCDANPWSAARSERWYRLPTSFFRGNFQSHDPDPLSRCLPRGVCLVPLPLPSVSHFFAGKRLERELSHATRDLVFRWHGIRKAKRIFSAFLESFRERGSFEVFHESSNKSRIIWHFLSDGFWGLI